MTPPFVRRVELEATPGRVLATLEDYNHHFEVTVEHDGTAVTAISTETVRGPWSTCHEAGAVLGELVGAPVGVRPATAKADQHCTHQIDLACVGVRFAGLGVDHRRFDVTVTDYTEPVQRASIVRDDGLRLDWTVEQQVITAPPEHAGRSLRSGFTGWAVGLPPDEAEAVLILRRAAWMAFSRSFSLDQFASLADSGLPEGSCYSAQPQRIALARRNVGMARDQLLR